jgi:hypothetical protein
MGYNFKKPDRKRKAAASGPEGEGNTRERPQKDGGKTGWSRLFCQKYLGKRCLFEI